MFWTEVLQLVGLLFVGLLSAVVFAGPIFLVIWHIGLRDSGPEDAQLTPFSGLSEWRQFPAIVVYENRNQEDVLL